MTKEEFLAGIPFIIRGAYGNDVYIFVPTSKSKGTPGWQPGHLVQTDWRGNHREYHCNIRSVNAIGAYAYTSICNTTVYRRIKFSEIEKKMP